MPENTFTTTIQNRCAIVTLHNDPVNALSKRLVQPLIREFDRLEKNAQVLGIIFTSNKNKIFISGADITEFGKGNSVTNEFVPFLDRIERCQKPVICVINGVALGGGLEFAMATHYRIAVANRNVQLGLVELQIGIIPGAAGTQRLPRLVGTKKATQMMLFSQKLRYKQAKEVGLVDEVVASNDDGIHRAMKMVRQLNRDPSQIRRASLLTDKVDPRDEIIVRDILKKLDRSGKTKNQIRFKACCDAIIDGLLNGYESGIKAEAKEFAKCLGSAEARGMMNFFFGTRRCHVVKGITDQGYVIPKIQTVAVLGGGTMGIGIAGWLLMNRCKVVVKEVNDEMAAKAVKKVASLWAGQVKRGRMSKGQVEALLSNLTTQSTYDNFNKVDMVIEAIFENIPLKQKIFKELEKVTRDDCILASNTSTIDINVIAEGTNCKKRIIGLHFFAPSLVMPLVEVINNKDTSPQVTNAMVQLVKKFRKIPIVVGNCVGFLINRFFSTYGQAATFLIERGVGVYDIDRVCKNYGMTLGLFETGDLSGLDVHSKVNPILRSAYGKRYLPKRPKSLVDMLVADGRLGQKTGSGYYQYKGRKSIQDPELQNYIDKYLAQPGMPEERLTLTDEEIFEFVFFPIFNECVMCLEEGVALKESDIDVGSITAMGLAQYRGGFMCDAKRIGLEYIGKKLSEWEEKYGEVFFKPADSKYFFAPEKTPGSEFTAAPLFEKFQAILAVHGEQAVEEVGHVFGFEITKDSQVRKWIINLKDGKGFVKEGSLDGAEVVIKMKDKHAYKLLTGRLDPMGAYSEGKFTLDGDLSAAFSLQGLTAYLPQGKAKL